MSAATGWEGILEPGEEILWQGRPDAEIRWSDLRPQKLVFGLFYAGFAVFWMVAAGGMVWGGPMGGGPFALFPLFGIPFLLIGLNIMGGHVIWDAYKRGRTWYTLTDRRAFAATAVLGIKRLRAVRIEEATPAEMTADVPPSLRIGPRVGEMVVFEHAPGARDAFRHLRGIQARLRRA